LTVLSLGSLQHGIPKATLLVISMTTAAICSSKQTLAVCQRTMNTTRSTESDDVGTTPRATLRPPRKILQRYPQVSAPARRSLTAMTLSRTTAKAVWLQSALACRHTAMEVTTP